MAEKPRRLSVRLSIEADHSLAHIWRGNATSYGERHADGYIKFLTARTKSLCNSYLAGRVVPTNPSFRYKILRKRSRGFGYVVVYQVREAEVYVVDFFHTAQNWQAQVAFK